MGDYPSLSSSSSSLSCASDCDQERVEHAPPLWGRQRNTTWERRRCRKSDDDLTDEDLKELKGCIELGFGFNAEDGHRLCTTIPALDLYFAVNSRFFTSPLPSPGSGATPPLLATASAASIPTSPLSCSFSDSDSRKILSPGDDPQQVKTKLRHWAQAVACSVMQSPIRGGGME